MVDFYDDRSLLIDAGRFPARRTATGDDIMNPAGMPRVAKPVATKTYRLWLLKYGGGDGNGSCSSRPCCSSCLLVCCERRHVDPHSLEAHDYGESSGGVLDNFLLHFDAA